MRITHRNSDGCGTEDLIDEEVGELFSMTFVIETLLTGAEGFGSSARLRTMEKRYNITYLGCPGLAIVPASADTLVVAVLNDEEHSYWMGACPVSLVTITSQCHEGIIKFREC